MRIVIFLSFYFFFSTLANSQNVLELKDAATGKTKILKQGAKLFFKTKNDTNYIKGKIAQIKDTSIVIYCTEYEDEMALMDIRLSDMKAIKKATAFHGTYRTAGKVFMPVGSVLFLRGILGLLRDDSYKGQSYYNDDLLKAYTYSGLAITAIGVVPYLIKQKEYYFNGGWSLSVKN
ncbi:MAG: hypothetical protein K2X86_09035 [Cytophagaceae bacterium]|nr:hypothetical protein [Cytophagaceae bacterium]